MGLIHSLWATFTHVRRDDVDDDDDDDDDDDACDVDNDHLQKNRPKDVRKELLVGRMCIRFEAVGSLQEPMMMMMMMMMVMMAMMMMRLMVMRRRPLITGKVV